MKEQTDTNILLVFAKPVSARICCIGAGYVGGPTMATIALKCPQLEATWDDMGWPSGSEEETVARGYE